MERHLSTRAGNRADAWRRATWSTTMLVAAAAAAAQLPAQNTNRRYLEDLSGVTPGAAATTAQANANTVAVNNALVQGGAWYMRSGSTIAISSSLKMVSNESIIGEGPVKPVLFMNAGGFTNTAPDDSGANAASAVAILAQGQTSTPYTSLINVRVENIEINGNRSTNDNRFLVGMSLRNVADPSIVGVTVRNMPAAYGIRADTILGHPVITDFQALDFYSNANFGTGYGGAQLTGIRVDGSRTNTTTGVAVSSANVLIQHPVIQNLDTGAVFRAAHGDQTDGINLQYGAGHIVRDADIFNVNEAIDDWTTDGLIIGGRYDLARGSALKFAFGAARKLILSPVITRSGINGIVIGGDNNPQITTPVNTLTFVNPLISNIDPSGSVGQSYGFRIDGNDAPANKLPSHITVVGGRINPGAGTTLVADWLDSSLGNSNVGFDLDLSSPTAPGSGYVGRVRVNAAGGVNNLQMVRPLGSSAFTDGLGGILNAEQFRFRFQTIGGKPFGDQAADSGISYAGLPVISSSGLSFAGAPVVNSTGKITGSVVSSTYGALPAPAAPGRLAWVTNAANGQGGLFVDSGTAWSLLGSGGTIVRGDEDALYTYSSSHGLQYFNVPLTGNRQVQLSSTGAVDGATVLVVRAAAATGSSTLTINPLDGGPQKLLAPGTWARAYYVAGLGWRVVEAGAL